MLFPDLARASITVDDRRIEGDALAAACDDHIAALAASGIGPGDRAAVETHRTLETAIALAAQAAAGICTVPLSPALGPRERTHILTDAHLLPRGHAPRKQETSHQGHTDSPLLLLYTSGTTGAPKGAMLTAENIASNLDALADAWAWTDRDHVVHALPLFHVHGLVLGLFGVLRRGGRLTWVTRFSPDAIADALDAGGTMLFGVPTMYHRLAEAAERSPRVADSLRRARLLVSGSAALPLREHQRIARATGRAVIERYGLTETLIDCAVRPDAPQPGRVGPPLPGVELRLVDDARAPIDAHDDATIGEVAVRGPNVFAGYLNREDATAAVLDADGWFYTGDLATRAGDGSIRIIGRRATDLIKTGGFKVGAGEVEASLLEHPAVAEAAVIGVPDEDLGERIVAFVVVREGHEAPPADDLSQHVASELAPHKRPRSVRFVESLPRNAMGKVQKRRLGELG